MRLLDLFSGIGGFSLAAQWVWGDELEIVAFCEIDKFCQKVLRKHFPEVPIIEDITKVEWVVEDPIQSVNGGQEAERRQTINGDACPTNAIRISRIDLLTAGFPCQPFSCAGRRAGTGDDRYLWPETIRTIREVRSSWVVLENVAGLLSILEPNSLSEMEIKEIELFQQDENIEVNKIIESIHRRIISRVIDDIKQAGYLLPILADGTPIILCLPACGVKAPHRRDRIWIVAYNSQLLRYRKYGSFEAVTDSNRKKDGLFKSSDCNVENSRDRGLSECGAKREGGAIRQIRETSPNDVEKTNCDVAYPDRLNGDDAGHGSGEVSQFKETEVSGCDFTNTHGKRSQIGEVFGRNIREKCKTPFGNPWQEHWYEVAPRFCQLDDGISNRLGGCLTYPETHGIMGFILLLRRFHYATSEETRSREILSILREAFGEKSIQRCFGRFSPFYKAQDLWCSVHGKMDGERKSNEVDAPQKGKETSKKELRNMSNHKESYESPQGWGCDQRCSCKFDDVVRELSHEIALGEWKNNTQKAENILFDLWQESRGERFLYEPLSALYKIWRSLTDKEIGSFRRHYNKRNEYRVQKLKSLGNSIVPQVAAEIFRAIRELE